MHSHYDVGWTVTFKNTTYVYFLNVLLNLHRVPSGEKVFVLIYMYVIHVQVVLIRR